MAGAKKGHSKKDSGKKEAETVGHVTKKGGVHHKAAGSTKKGNEADVSGHIVARSAKKGTHKRGDDPSVHAK